MEIKSRRIKLGNGIHLNVIETDKFKSNILSYYFMRPLNREEATKNAMIPLVLKRGTEKFNTALDIEKELENMYGASYSSAINKRGERHIIRFSMEWARGDYLKDNTQNLKAADMLRGLIYNPYLEEGTFKESYIEQEKENHRIRIEGRINDKRSYAVDRCIEEMCKYEPYNIYQLGYVEDLENINKENLYHHYKEVLETSPIEIFYVGQIDQELEEHLINDNKLERNTIVDIPREKVISTINQRNAIEERLEVNQGKLVIGYRTGIPYEDKLYNGLLIASDILGGGPNSKLFKNVREAESLAYYISSSVLKYKSIMIIDAGIEFNNNNKTIEIIGRELEELKKGNFRDEDIEISKRSIKTSTESIKDSAFLISEFFFSKCLSKDERSLEQILDDFNQVTREDIVEAANKIKIDTIYFMRDK